MQKTGIISYHRAINYGALLQVYALQEKIKELGSECEIIDYRNEILESKHKKIKISECKSIKEYLRYFILGKAHNEKFDKFREFSSEYLNISEVCHNKKDLEMLSEKYSKVITGSDQVWNHNINGLDKAYYLDFLSERKKKNSFSASFGYKELIDDYKDEYKKLLKEYNMISVREKHGADIIEDLIGYRPSVVLDPTMLKTKEEWFDFANEYENKNKYILIYGFSGKNHMMDLAKNIAKETGYQIVIIQNNHLPSFNIKYEKTAGPKDFLGIFKNAEYILTNSFHGTAFSINLNKEFFTELLPESTKVNSRLEHVLNLFDLEDRRITGSNPDIIEDKIDYNKVNKKLNNERKKSIQFLQEIIDS
jgi:hypothetical protein